MAKTSKKSSAKRKSSLKKKMDQAVAHEKDVSKRVAKIPTADVKDFGKMNSEKQRKILFNQFPGDAMGITVGKADPNDPYNAMIPKDNT